MPSIGRIPQKKKETVQNWMDQDELVVDDEVVADKAVPAWMLEDEIVEDDTVTMPRFTEDQINANYEAPAGVRLEIAGLSKPEDKLAALRKQYPDAEPYGDGNFAMTNPENGEAMLFNREGWIPSVGDFAESVPTIAEIGGAIGGGIFGGAGGATAGSAVPVVGTAAGGVAGAMAGAGAGGAGARDIAERAINWGFGNEDTRTLGEYAKDKAVDVGLNAAGEGAGMAIAKGVGMAARPIHKMIAGKADDAAKATQLAEDYAGANIPSTTGTITQNQKALTREATIARDNPQSRIAQRMDETDEGISNEFFRLQNGLAAQTDSTLRPTTGQSVGDSLIGKAGEANASVNAQRNALYNEVDQIVGPTTSAGNQSTSQLLARLNSEKKGLGASAKMNHGAMLDEVAKQTKAASDDLKNMNFGQMQEMRSTIGKMAFGKETDPYLASRYKDLYKSITDDMAETAKSAGPDAHAKWKEADAFNASLYGPDSTKEALKAISKAPDGETAFKRVLSKVREGGTALSKTRQEIEAVGGAAQWDQMTATYINKIGVSKAADGAEVFSPRKFVTEWNKMAPEAKDAMFAGTGRSQYRSDLDRLARIIDARQSAMKVKGRAVDQGTRLFLNWASAGAAPAFRAGKNSYMDRLLTNPQVVKWMTGIPQAQMTRGGLSQHISYLRNIAREAIRLDTGNGAELKSAIDAYLADAGFQEDENE
jgi:hypothetical protein